MNTRVTIFRYTGTQGFFTIPSSACQECDTTIHLAQHLIAQFPAGRVRLTIRPWWLCFWKVLWRGGWHPPIVTINGRVLSQGVVPEASCFRQALVKALNRQSFSPCLHAV
ncbi:MAG: hypothetical protein HY421_01640 [Candidatus Kerfeldbacteria bacterium]|nr:hypothetical protein [Candidatus Kerfeldbacteria bacterium]